MLEESGITDYGWSDRNDPGASRVVRRSGQITADALPRAEIHEMMKCHTNHTPQSWALQFNYCNLL